MKKIPDKIDEDFRMSLVAMKNKLLALNESYEFDFLTEAIEYLQDVKNFTMKSNKSITFEITLDEANKYGLSPRAQLKNNPRIKKLFANKIKE